MSAAIHFENVSKQYRLGEVGTGTLSHDLHRAWARLRGKPDPFAKVGQVNDRTVSGGEYVYALKDINFKVEQGEILGIIGRNGAGKSTLLKLLSRVTAPTSGCIKAKGRIASLLEVGTGFHPELTGRENIYLNGTILGMRRHEINRQLDEIVEFSGCAKYLDTPVKRYSSGMAVRLGFAVAAYLDCEILVVDEVLAVGDAEFQKKCMGKMEDIAGGGRTVLFVSHNLASMQSICNTGVLLSQGNIIESGKIDSIVQSYLDVRSEVTEYKGTSRVQDRPWIKHAKLMQDTSLDKVFFFLTTWAPVSTSLAIDLRITDHMSFPVGYGTFGSLENSSLVTVQKGETEISFALPLTGFANGSYSVSIDLNIPHFGYFDRAEHCLRFDVLRSATASGATPLNQSWGHGSMLLQLSDFSLKK